MHTIIFSDNSLWGCINFRGAVIEYFINKGFNVVVVAPEDKTLIAQQLPAGTIYEPITMGRNSSNPFDDIKYMRKLKEIYKKYNPIIAFHYTIKPNIYGTFAANSLKIPSVAMVTGLGYVFDNSGIIAKAGRFLYKKGLSKALTVLFLNAENYELMLEKGFVNLQNSVLLKGGEGIDLTKFIPAEQPGNVKPVFLMIARILYDKGYNEYVAAAKANPNAEFRLIGAIDSNPNAVPKEIVENESAIRYLGFMSKAEVIENIKQSDCIVLPSYYKEGLNISLCESASLAKPIITTDIAGCREIVDDGINGYIIPPKDVSALIDACSRFVSLPVTERQKMGAASRHKAENTFSVDNVIEIYRSIVEKITR